MYDGTGPVARLRRAEEALIEQTLQEMAVRAHAATASEAASVADALNKRGCLAWASHGNSTEGVPSEFRRAIIADPKNAMAHINPGVILEARQRLAEVLGRREMGGKGAALEAQLLREA